MMKDSRPLYLDGVQPLAVALDGPALKVTGQGRSPGRYPLRRLSRVVVSGAVEWATAALVGCLRAGVVVTFLDGEGELAGVCMGAGTHGTSIHDRLREFALRPDWPQHYATWYTAMERRAILHAVNALSLRVPDLRPATVRQAYAARLHTLATQRIAQRTVGYLEAVVAACAATSVAECGIPPTLLAEEGEGFQFGRDLGRLLAWDARVLAARLLAREWPQGAPTRRDLADAMERRMGRMLLKMHEYMEYLERTATSLNYGEAC